MEKVIRHLLTKRIFLLLSFMIMTLCSFAYGYATIDKVWLEHGVTSNGENGMRVHVTFNTVGVKGNKIEVIAYIHDANKKVLYGGIDGYKSDSGQICASSKSTATYEKSTWSDFKIFIPIKALRLFPGKHTYYVQVQIYDVTQKKFIETKSSYVSFTGTGSSNSNQNYYANNSKSSNRSNGTNKKWREDLGYGLFAINEGDPNGTHIRTVYRTCVACRGTATCQNCYGTGYCTICGGQGYITTAGYGSTMLCMACNSTGKCRLCNGTGKCACSKSDYPGYMPSQTTTYGYDGKPMYDSGVYGSGSSGSSSSSSRSSSSSSRCYKCHGTGVDPTPLTGNSMPQWYAYTNSLGSKCPYCSETTSHHHDRCSVCNTPSR